MKKPYDFKADCFSLGVIAYILCVQILKGTGNCPVDAHRHSMFLFLRFSPYILLPSRRVSTFFFFAMSCCAFISLFLFLSFSSLSPSFSLFLPISLFLHLSLFSPSFSLLLPLALFFSLPSLSVFLSYSLCACHTISHIHLQPLFYLPACVATRLSSPRRTTTQSFSISQSRANGSLTHPTGTICPKLVRCVPVGFDVGMRACL